jgi:hypothetical protein
MRFPLLMYIAVFSVLIPIIIGILKANTKNRAIQIFVLYLIIRLTVDSVSIWFIREYYVDLNVLHIFILTEYILLMLVLYFWQTLISIKKVLLTLILLYIFFWVIAKFSFEPFNGLYSFSLSVSQGILALSAGYTLFVVTENRAEPLATNPRFWFLVSMVFYFIGTLIPTALVGVFFKERGQAPLFLWSVNWLVAIISNLLYTIGFLCPQIRR